MWMDVGHVLALPWARVILVCVFLEGLLLYGPFAFIASHLHRRFDLALSSAGAVVMLFALGGLAFAIASPRLVRRLGEVGLAACGGALLCAAWLLVAWAPAWEAAAIGIGLAGVGFYMLHSTLQLNATQMAPARRGPAVASFAAAFFLGQSAGVAVAGSLLEPLGATVVIALAGAGLLTVAWTFAAIRAKRPSPS
jgi:predicted MFS family arabinose efflux permease